MALDASAKLSRSVAAVLTLNSHLPGLAAVQRVHALDLRERHKVAILKTVASLVKAGNERVWAVLDVDNHTSQWVLSSGVNAGEVVAKVVEDGAGGVSTIPSPRSPRALTQRDRGRRQQ